MLLNGLKTSSNYSQHLDLVNFQSPQNYNIRYDDHTVKTWDDDPVPPRDLPIFAWPRKGVTQIAASSGAFTAMAEGGVVTWGRAGDGGDSSAVESQLVMAGRSSKSST